MRRREAHRRDTLLGRSVDDPDAFVELYRRYFRRIVIFLTRRVLDPEVALDLASETFAVVLERRREFRGVADAEQEAWIFAIAHSRLSRFARRRQVERRALDRLGIQRPDVTIEEWEQIEEAAGIRDVVADLRSALAELPPEQRDAVRLRIVEEWEYERVAEQVEATPAAVRMRVSRGLRTLALALDKHRPERTEA